VRGWERVTPTDLARLAAPKQRPAEARQKYRAEPCIVTPDGTLFTAADITTAEFAQQRIGTGTLKERAARCAIVGLWFASTKEGRRYLELKRLEQAKAISDLQCQVEYDLTVVSIVDGRTHVVGKWIADFVYRRAGEVAFVTEDTKGVKTKLYRRSRRHFEAQYGMPILET